MNKRAAKLLSKYAAISESDLKTLKKWWNTLTWEEKSKERKRLTSNRFLDRYFIVLKKGGTLSLKTDSDFLYDYSLEIMKNRGQKIEVASPDIYMEMQKFDFDEGLPKVHQHDGKSPKGFGIIYEGRLVCFYSYESDLGNGWEDQSVYNDPQSIRIEALKMGANIISYVFTSES